MPATDISVFMVIPEESEAKTESLTNLFQKIR